MEHKSDHSLLTLVWSSHKLVPIIHTNTRHATSPKYYVLQKKLTVCVCTQNMFRYQMPFNFMKNMSECNVQGSHNSIAGDSKLFGMCHCHWTSTSLFSQQHSVTSHTACFIKQVQGQISKYFAMNNTSRTLKPKKMSITFTWNWPRTNKIT